MKNIYTCTKPNKILENKKRILRQKNSRILKELSHCFQQHQKYIYTKCHLTFKHEYGHVKEALELGFTFTLIALFDKYNKKHHLFYLNDGKIKYGYIDVNKVDNPPRGISYFYSSYATNSDWKKVSIGGFVSDMLLTEKSYSESKNSFGDTLESKLHPMNSDYHILKRLSQNENYYKELNKSFKSIHNYLYSSIIEEIPKSKLPLDKYRALIKASNI